MTLLTTGDKHTSEDNYKMETWAGCTPGSGAHGRLGSGKQEVRAGAGNAEGLEGRGRSKSYAGGIFCLS